MRKIMTVALVLCTMCFAQNTFTDQRDGKTYKTVKIGTQTWMAQNLNYAGENDDIGVCQGNDPKNCQKNGRLYDWENAILACPDGWHLPDYDEWQTLVTSAGGGIAGQKLKAKSGWEKWDCEWTATDDRGRPKKISKCNSDNYGFSALPNSSDGQSGSWWMAATNYYNATAIVMLYNSEDIRRNSYSKSQTLSVRCLKGEGKLPSELIAKRNALAAEEATKKAEKIAEAANPLTTEDTEEGTILRGSTLAKKLAWLDRSAESHNTYIIEVNADENIEPYKFEYKNAINITIVLRGDSENRTIRLKSHGRMFTVEANVTLILDSNITLKGHSQNPKALIVVESGGILKMNAGVTITGNVRPLDNSGGGGVHIASKGTFTMNGGTISGNAASSGGGVYNNGTFTMNGGIISGNAANYGGGVYNEGTFTMSDGNISGNTANSGGGVWAKGTFTMRDGTITSNIAREKGGGVYLEKYFWHSVFIKTSGTITGYNSDRNEGNVVKDEEGVLARNGHAVSFDNSKKRKETTAGPDDDLSCQKDKSINMICTGAWDDSFSTAPAPAAAPAFRGRPQGRN